MKVLEHSEVEEPKKKLIEEIDEDDYVEEEEVFQEKGDGKLHIS